MYTYIKSKYWIHWGLSLTAVLLVGVAMTQFAALEVHNLIQIEFAKTADELAQLLQPYSNTTVLYYNTLTDFIFIITYTLLFYYSGRILCDLLEFTRTRWLLLLLLPASLDVAENLLLLEMLSTVPHDYSSFCFFYWAVRLKWLLVIPGMLLALVVLLFQAYVGVDRVYCWWKSSGQ